MTTENICDNCGVSASRWDDVSCLDGFNHTAIHDRPNAVLNDKGKTIGYATYWNIHGIGECIVQYLDGSADSAIFSELKFKDTDAARLYLDAKEYNCDY